MAPAVQGAAGKAAKCVDAGPGLGRREACVMDKRKRGFLAQGALRAMRVMGEWR